MFLDAEFCLCDQLLFIPDGYPNRVPRAGVLRRLDLAELVWSLDVWQLTHNRSGTVDCTNCQKDSFSFETGKIKIKTNWLVLFCVGFSVLPRLPCLAGFNSRRARVRQSCKAIDVDPRAEYTRGTCVH